MCKCHRPCSGTTDKQRWSSQGPCTIPCNRQRKRRRIGRWRRCRRYNREAAAHVGELAAAVATVMVVAVEAVEANEVVVCRKHRPCTSTSHSGPMGRWTNTRARSGLSRTLHSPDASTLSSSGRIELDSPACALGSTRVAGPRFSFAFPESACNRHGTKPKKHTQGLGPAPHASRAHTHAQLHRQQPSKGSKRRLKHLCEVTLCLVVQGGTSTASSTGSVTGRRLSTHDGACVAARWQEPQVSHSRLNRAGARFRAA